MRSITPFLWFDHDKAEEAAKFYVSIFKKDSKIKQIVRYPKGTPGPFGKVMLVCFRLRGQDFFALNGRSEFKFNESVSFCVGCKTQREVDYFWKKLTKGGEPNVCGWLKDKYGLSWQIVPDDLEKLFKGDDLEKTQHLMAEVMKMTKPDVGVMRRAAKGPAKTKKTKSK